MPKRKSVVSGSELFIVDNSDDDWKVQRYLHDWCQLSKQFDIATGYFEIGSLLGLDGEWQKVDKIRVLMGDYVSGRTRKAFAEASAENWKRIKKGLDDSLESAKDANAFLAGVPGTVLRSASRPTKVNLPSLSRSLIIVSRYSSSFFSIMIRYSWRERCS